MKINFNKKNKFNDEISKYFNKTIEVLQISENVSCDLFFVGKRKIRKTNKQFRNNDKVTDVLSFPSALESGRKNMQQIDWQQAKLTSFDPVSETIFLGDILVCMAKAKNQAKEYGHGLHREVCYLCVHGLLHLLGYDHMIDSDKKIMRELEEKILSN